MSFKCPMARKRRVLQTFQRAIKRNLDWCGSPDIVDPGFTSSAHHCLVFDRAITRDTVPHIRSSLDSTGNSYHLLRKWPNKTSFYFSWVQWLKAMGPGTMGLGVSEAFTLWSRIGIWEQKLVCFVRHFPTCYSVELYLQASRDIKIFCRYSVSPVNS